jgi:hypothetical protein
MKKYLLCIFLFAIFTTAYTQEFTMTITKTEILDDIKYMRSQLIDINSDLVYSISDMQKNKDVTMTDYFMDMTNTSLICIYRQTVIYGAFIQSKSIEDDEVIQEFIELQRLLETCQTLYTNAQELHFANISKPDISGTDILNSLNLFLGSPFMKLLSRLK